jgi:hypothetical protein
VDGPSGLLFAGLSVLEQNVDLIAEVPDGRLLLIETKAHSQVTEAAARAEVERAAPRNETLDELIDRYPLRAEWRSEPGWSDAG